MGEDFFHILDGAHDRGLPWDELSFRRHPVAPWLIWVDLTAQFTDADRVAEKLSDIWVADLAYSYLEGHTVLIDGNRIALLAVTQMDPEDLWVTARVQVELRTGSATVANRTRGSSRTAEPRSAR